MTTANLELTKEEYAKLHQSGHVEFDDPERGHIEAWLIFDEDHQGIKGKHLRLTIHRAGTAATRPKWQ